MAEKAQTIEATTAEVKRPVATREALKAAEERYFEVASYKQNTWMYRAFRRYTVEDLTQRGFWSQVARKLRPGDKIVAMREDGGFYVELIVFAVGSNWAETRMLAPPVHGSSMLIGSSAADDFAAEYRGTIQQWVVVRKSDGHLVKNDGTLLTEEACRNWISEHVRTLFKSRAA